MPDFTTDGKNGAFERKQKKTKENMAKFLEFGI